MGVEPTKDRLAALPGFEVRTPHQGRFPSEANDISHLSLMRWENGAATGRLWTQVGAKCFWNVSDLIFLRACPIRSWRSEASRSAPRLARHPVSIAGGNVGSPDPACLGVETGAAECAATVCGVRGKRSNANELTAPVCDLFPEDGKLFSASPMR